MVSRKLACPESMSTYYGQRFDIVVGEFGWEKILRRSGQREFAQGILD